MEACFLCPEPGTFKCEECDSLYCADAHGDLHRRGGHCFPYKVILQKKFSGIYYNVPRMPISKTIASMCASILLHQGFLYILIKDQGKRNIHYNYIS